MTATTMQGSKLWRLLGMSIAGLALYFLATVFLKAPCWILFFITAVTAWPIWLYQRDVVLFERRIILSGVAKEGGWVKRWFWEGRVSQVVQVFVSLIWATILLALATLMKPEHWGVLAADVLFLSLIIDPVRRRLGLQVREDQLGIVASRWPLFALNLAFLTLAFVVIDFFIAGVPDTRGAAWHQVAEEAFGEFDTARCQAASWIVGIFATVDRLAWHASQMVIPRLPSPTLKLVAWGIVLVHAGLAAYLFTRLQLGIVSLVNRAPRGKGGPPTESAFSLAFIYTILFLTLPSIYALLKLENLSKEVDEGVTQVIDWANPCEMDTEARSPVLAKLGSDLERAREEAQANAEREIDVELDRLFADVEQGVERYLDWYFSVIGGYERLASSVGVDFGREMGDMVYWYLFEKTGFASRLEAASHKIEVGAANRLTEEASRAGENAHAEMKVDSCLREHIDFDALGNLDHDRVRASVAAGSGVATGAVAAKLLAKKAGASVAAKIAAKQGFKAAAGMAGKTVAKKGGSIVLSAAAGAAICSPSGPIAVACGIAAGAVTWLTVDKVMVEVDEALFRDELRAELMGVLTEERLALAVAIKARLAILIDDAALQINEKVQRVFIPARDGL